jgi:hypothetical protein
MAYRSPTYWAAEYFAPGYFSTIAGGAPANPVQPDWRYAAVAVSSATGVAPDPAFATVAVHAAGGIEPDPAFATAVLS